MTEIGHAEKDLRSWDNIGDDELLDSKDAARYLKVSVATLYRWRSHAEGPVSSKAGGLKYRMGDLRAHLRSTAKGAVAA